MMSEIKKILVANRGEIALRAIRTIKEMGKQAIAVYSTEDENALYLQYADAAICIGGAKSSESYLNVPSIISAAEISGCDAIFPGYGFLSENQDFVEICKIHKLTFIGPTVDSMVLMSDKSKAKEVMKKAGVPVIEGSEGALKNIDEAKVLANKIGYPVIVKASAGGGGRGMRVVEKEEDLEIAYLSAESEAALAFGDGTLYMEKFIKNPRHIEVQILGDSFGNAVHIGERDCSLQRRHQKLIEESPAEILDDETRKNLHKAAVNAVKYIGYENAGTFEFLLDNEKNFYFMEMNTRLQVEHCVSEMVSGIDIIEWMIKIAEGKKLPKQEDITLKGHSIECRITAEDPVKFIPSPGKVIRYVAPGGRNVRVDSHLYQNYVIPSCYDSLIGKLIVVEADRDRAIAKMKEALTELQIEGVATVRDFHLKMMDNPDFINNNFDTNYLSRY